MYGYSTLANANASLANFQASKQRQGWTAKVLAIAAQDTVYPVSAAMAPDPKWQSAASFK